MGRGDVASAWTYLCGYALLQGAQVSEAQYRCARSAPVSLA